MPPRESPASSVGLPIRPFLYTIDQICSLTMISEQALQKFLYYEFRSSGQKPPSTMLARNISQRDDRPDWRVAEKEFIRWLRFKQFRVYETGSVKY